MEERYWSLRIRPSNPRNGRRLQPEDFYKIEKAPLVVFEKGIEVGAISPSSRTVILKNNYFCAVRDYVKYSIGKTPHRGSHPTTIHICLPGAVEGREVLFYSPQIDPLTIR